MLFIKKNRFAYMLTVFYRLFDKIVDVIYHQMNHREKS